VKWKIEPNAPKVVRAPKLLTNAARGAAIIAKEQALGASGKGTYSVLKREQARSMSIKRAPGGVSLKFGKA
jgi:hypothetical protein